MEFEKPYIVYVKHNEAGHITAVNSSAFLADTAGWTEIDCGCGDKYHHAQGNYFPEPILTKGGACRYKLVDGKTEECTAEEIAEWETQCRKDTVLSQEERIAELEAQLALLKEKVREILGTAGNK